MPHAKYAPQSCCVGVYFLCVSLRSWESAANAWEAIFGWGEGRATKIKGQITRYQNQLNDKGPEILNVYRKYVNILHEIFDIDEVKLPLPESIDHEVTILMFGYDDNQKSKISDLLIDDGSLNGLSLRKRGNFNDKKFTAETLSKKIERYWCC